MHKLGTPEKKKIPINNSINLKSAMKFSFYSNINVFVEKKNCKDTAKM